MSFRSKMAVAAWLKWNKLKFLMLPVERRACLSVQRDGRYLTSLLTAMAEAGYGVQMLQSPMAYRELNDLRHAAPMPFVIGGEAQRCGLLIREEGSLVKCPEAGREVVLDLHYFDARRTEPRMPYFMHPAIYRAGLHRMPDEIANRERLFRLGFFGTHDPVFYRRHFRLPMLSRSDILEFFLSTYGEGAARPGAEKETWTRAPIALSVDERGGDRQGKAFLPMSVYLQALRSSDFFLSPPGFIMPFSHNLIEGMAAGSIPLLNYPGYLTPPLRDGVECLAFETLDDLRRCVARILAMPAEEIARMRAAVRHYYKTHLELKTWLQSFLALDPPVTTLLVNNEEVSMGLSGQNLDAASWINYQETMRHSAGLN